MFCGANAINIDNKGRLAIPTRYRDLLSDGMVCTIGLHSPCLMLYSANEWSFIAAKLSSLSSMIESEKRITRLLLGHAVEMMMDNAGRILLTQTLRKYAQLEKNTMFVGQGNKFEIWNESIWNEQIMQDISAVSFDSSDLSDNLRNLVL